MEDLRNRMKKSVEHTRSQLSTIRTGRANPDILSRVMVDYYGSSVPLNQVGSVSVPEPMMLSINVFDKAAVSSVEKAINVSDLGLNPNVDGSVIRLRLPELTEERRRDLSKIVKKEGEEGRVALRNHRRDYLDQLKKQEKDKEISEDDLKSLSDEVQKITDEYSAKIDQLVKDKEAELMKI